MEAVADAAITNGDFEREPVVISINYLVHPHWACIGHPIGVDPGDWQISKAHCVTQQSGSFWRRAAVSEIPNLSMPVVTRSKNAACAGALSSSRFSFSAMTALQYSVNAGSSSTDPSVTFE